MIKKFQGVIILFFIIIGTIILISDKTSKERSDEVMPTQSLSGHINSFIKDWENPIEENSIKDEESVYAQDKDDNLDNIYITILPPKGKENVSFWHVNNIIMNTTAGEYSADDKDPMAEILFFEDSPGPYTSTADGTIEIRGQSSRRAKLKSYKIKLYDRTEAWHGVRILNLNKHYGDRLRIRNKLSFDFFEKIPDIPSMRTRFVHLHVKDLSAGKNYYESYGLFTFIEQVNPNYLERHGLDANGNIYKAEFFEFYRYEDIIKTVDDIFFDRNKFENILEVRGNEDHREFIEMLEDLNDYSNDINDILDKYFDRDNMYTWLAANLLMENYDTSSRNYIIYSPLNSEKWFFIPWDYDGTWKYQYDRPEWQKGISNYWGNLLFNRVLKKEENREELTRKVKEVYKILNPENTKKYLDTYYPVVKDFVLKYPDNQGQFYFNAYDYKNAYYDIVDATTINRDVYYKSLEKPMPFFLGTPEYVGNKIKFPWTPSYDFQNDEIEYSFSLSRNPQMTNIIYHKDNLKRNSIELNNLPGGKYYWKVIAYDSNGNQQGAFDILELDDYYFGVKEFVK